MKGGLKSEPNICVTWRPFAIDLRHRADILCHTNMEKLVHIFAAKNAAAHQSRVRT